MTNSFEPAWKLPGRRSLLGMTAAASVLGPIWTAQAQVANSVARPVADLYAGLQTAMHAGGSFEQRFNLLAPVMDRDFDLNTILQTSVGLRWASLDAGAKQNLSAVFRAFTIASYTANFDKDGGMKFEVLPQTRISGSDVVVQSRLVPASGDPVRIDYVTRGGRIVDVLLNGSISRVAVQRSDFRSLLSSGNPGPLIDSLRQKVSELSGGTMRL
jgi:phospholipid transport system substrate-binding protein